MKYIERARNPYEYVAVYNVVKLAIIQNVCWLVPLSALFYLNLTFGVCMGPMVLSHLIVCAMRITALRKVKVWYFCTHLII